MTFVQLIVHHVCAYWIKVAAYHIAGNIGGEFNLADWRLILQIVKSPTSTVYSSKLLSPIALQPIGVSPHIYILYESTMCPLHAGENQEYLSFIVWVQQEIKVDLLHTVYKHCVHSKAHTSTLQRGVTTYLHILWICIASSTRRWKPEVCIVRH